MRKQPPEPEPTEDPPPRSAKARRKREPRAPSQPDYMEGPAGDKKCEARRANGSFCGQAAGWGTDHPGYGPCKFHMGATPAGRKNAANEMAGELMVFYGTPLDINPIDALLDEVRRTAGHIAWLADRIGHFDVPIEIEEEDDKGVKVRRPAGIPPEVDGWLRMYQSERGQLVRAAKACLDAGINERLVQIAEHQGAKLADAVEVILLALRLTPEQQALVPNVVPTVLRQLTSAQPILLEGVLPDETG